MKISHILVPTDLSIESQRPIQEAANLVRSTGGRLTLLTVVQDLLVAPHGAPLAPPQGDPEISKRVEEARAGLEEIGSDLSDLEVTLKAISAVDVAQAIVEEAENNDADLIAISTHGRTGWRRLALGSVAEQVVRRSSIPVLSFQRPHKES
ncbi:MAG: universal stress protein UspA [Deltaproteobacteria bacterium]|nr:universal stress protein UspA [Deltaproteobacteria bacterium]